MEGQTNGKRKLALTPNDVHHAPKRITVVPMRDKERIPPDEPESASPFNEEITQGFTPADSQNLPKLHIASFLEYINKPNNYKSQEVTIAGMLMSAHGFQIEDVIGYVELNRALDFCSIKARIVSCATKKMFTVLILLNEEKREVKYIKCNVCNHVCCRHGIIVAHWLMQRNDTGKNYWRKPKVVEDTSDYVLASDLGERREREYEKFSSDISIEKIVEECKKRNLKDSLLYKYFYDKESDDCIDNVKES